MNTLTATVYERQTTLRLGQCLTYLSASVAGLALLLAPVVWWASSERGLLAMLLAAAICWGTGAAALFATGRLVAIDQALVGMLLAMAIRMLPPLAVCLMLATIERWPELDTFVYCLVPFYLVALAVETWLSVRMSQSLPATRREDG